MAEIELFVFLPPLLNAAAITVSAHELNANWAPISLLAVGLVLVTIAAVAAVAKRGAGCAAGSRWPRRWRSRSRTPAA